jgi:hypothetical protein
MTVDLVFGEVHRVAEVHLEGEIGMGLSPVKIMEGARNPAESLGLANSANSAIESSDSIPQAVRGRIPTHRSYRS